MGRKIADQKIVLVTGKGGVGKSTVATLISKHLSQLGKSVLLVELSEVSALKHQLNINVDYAPQKFDQNAWISLFRGESCLKEFISYYIRLDAVVNLFFDNKIMRALVKAAPALRELAILGKITSGVRGVGPDFIYDFVVVDSAPTGHFQSLLQAPKAMGEIIDLGPMGEQSRGIDQTLKSPKNTYIINVTLAEELPLIESSEFINEIQALGFPEPSIVINKWVDLPKLGSQKVAPPADGFLEYLCLLGERQKYAESMFSGRSISKLPFDFEINLLKPSLESSNAMENVCASFLKNTK